MRTVQSNFRNLIIVVIPIVFMAIVALAIVVLAVVVLWLRFFLEIVEIDVLGLWLLVIP